MNNMSSIFHLTIRDSCDLEKPIMVATADREKTARNVSELSQKFVLQNKFYKIFHQSVECPRTLRSLSEEKLPSSDVDDSVRRTSPEIP